MSEQPIHTETQVEKLFNHLLTGCSINRVEAFQMYGIADLRSRICNVRDRYNLNIDRAKVTGKRYLKYFLPQCELK